MTASARSIFDVLLRAAGSDLDGDGTHLALPIKVDLHAAMVLTTPVAEPVLPNMPEHVEMARARLCADAEHEPRGHPVPDAARQVESAVVMQLAKYLEPLESKLDRLYVLEFQGFRQQYVMFGHTTNLMKRLVDHRLAANPHGFALLQGWVSPGVTNARHLERLALHAASWLQGSVHIHERFYEMPFRTGQSVARAVFELHTDWVSRSVT